MKTVAKRKTGKPVSGSRTLAIRSAVSCTDTREAWMKKASQLRMAKATSGLVHTLL